MDLTRLDPELAIALNDFPVLDIWDDLPAARIERAALLEEFRAQLPPVEGVVSLDHCVAATDEAPEVTVRVYRPVLDGDGHGALPAILWIHGGGYVMGSMEGDDYTVRNLVHQVGCMAVSVEYRLAPEHPYPAAIEDCYAALKWLSECTADLGVDPSRIAVGGVSAGGGLAAALALMARDRQEVEVMFQFLACPMIDDRNATPSSFAITDPRVWNHDCNRRGWAAYLGGHSPAARGYAAAARAEDLSGLPPAYIPVGEMDLFVDENIHYAQRLIEAAVAAELHVFPGGFHGFEFMAPGAAISRRTRALHYEVLRRALGLG